MGRIKPQDLLQQSKKKKVPSRISVSTIVLCFLILLLTLFFLYSTYKHWLLRSVESSDWFSILCVVINYTYFIVWTRQTSWISTWIWICIFLNILFVEMQVYGVLIVNLDYAFPSLWLLLYSMCFTDWGNSQVVNACVYFYGNEGVW